MDDENVEMVDITDEQRHILRHSLGLDERTDTPYRNYFAASGQDQDCQALVEMGLMRHRGSPGWTDLHYYHVTPAGMRAVGVDPEDYDDI